MVLIVRLPASLTFSSLVLHRYADVLSCADMIDQCPVRGCVILKPLSMDLWEAIRAVLDRQIRATGAKNYYFPLLIPASLLSMEASHIQGFAKECAVVTHHRLKANPNFDPSTDKPSEALQIDQAAKLDEPLVIRPTSEAAMWTSFRKWIHSHRDLPLKVNQWANVVRWEMRPRPFLRTSEFLWQEGHTAHATREDALETTAQMIEIYEKLCRVSRFHVSSSADPSLRRTSWPSPSSEESNPNRRPSLAQKRRTPLRD
jgi:prolyl-tRNA synthetase